MRDRFGSYTLIISAILLLSAVDLKVPVFEKGLQGTPFILVVVVAALIGDLTAGLLAVILSSLAVYYVFVPNSLDYNATALFKTLEFFIVSAILLVLSWKIRSLRTDNSKLIDNANKLAGIVSDLKRAVKGDKKEINKLNGINKDLVKLVDEFIADEEFWSNRLKVNMLDNQNQGKSRPRKRPRNNTRQTSI